MSPTVWRWFAALLVCAGAATIGTLALTRATSSASARPARAGSTGPIGCTCVIATLARPLPVQGAKQVSMSDAVSALGGTIPLPNMPSPSDIGAVWMNQFTGEETQTAVSVTFPSQGLIIDYESPAPSDPLAYFQATTASAADPQLIWLGGTPASYDQGHPGGWAEVQLIVSGATIDVLGHASEASLQTVAQSIVDRATSTS